MNANASTVTQPTDVFNPLGGRFVGRDSGEIISSQNRFSGTNRCPICGGTEDDPRGHGSRCFGFLSTDGQWAHCTREEHAGRATFNPGSNAFPHKLRGKCPCGAEHGPAELPLVRKKSRGTIEATYFYKDESWNLRFCAVRFKDPKRFAQYQPDGKSGKIWNLKGVKLVPYRLPELLAENLNKMVYIVEGEKDVEQLRSLGLTATCNPMGAGKWRDEYSEHLRGRPVIILPDNDRPGLSHAEDIARSVHGKAKIVKVVPLPGNAENQSGCSSDVSRFSLSSYRAIMPAGFGAGFRDHDLDREASSG